MADVNPDSPGAKAGLKQGDVIVKLDGAPVKDIASFRNKVASNPPGTRLTLTVRRDGKDKQVTATTGVLPDGDVGPAAPEAGAGASDDLGLSVTELTPELGQRFGYTADSGVIVSQVQAGSPAANARIESGSLITSVDRQPVNSVAAFGKAVSRADSRKGVLLHIKSARGGRYVVLRRE